LIASMDDTEDRREIIDYAVQLKLQFKK